MGKKSSQVIQQENEEIRIQYSILSHETATISSWQKENVLKRYGILIEDYEIRNFVVWYITAPKWLNEEGNIIIPWYLLHYGLQGRIGRQTKTGEYLLRIQEAFPGFEFREYSHHDGKCRVILKDGIPGILRTLIQYDPDEEERVYVHNLRKASDRKMAEKYKEMLAVLNDVKRAYPDVDLKVRYLHGLPLPYFQDLKQKNGKELLERAMNYEDDGQQLALVRQFFDMPKPLYPPSRSNNPWLARSFGTALCNMSSANRRIALKGKPEADLKSAHFAILARFYLHCMPATREILLSKDVSIWSAILEYMGIEKRYWHKAKAIIKEITYSLMYGREETYASTVLCEKLKGAGISWKNDYLDCVYIKELVTAMKKAKEDVLKYGGMDGAYCWIPWDGQTDLDSFLANVFQSFELFMIAPCYKLAESQKKNCNSDFMIILDQHDGFTYDPKPGKEKEVQRRLQEVVSTAASYCGALTYLEIKTSVQ